MNECSVCGVLSIGVDVCPACGSRIHKALPIEDSNANFGDLPGLSDAMISWREVVPDHELPSEAEMNEISNGGLPFSYQGESNQFNEALPFGIGSNSGGVPYELEKKESIEQINFKSENEIKQNPPDQIQSNTHPHQDSRLSEVSQAPLPNLDIDHTEDALEVVEVILDETPKSDLVQEQIQNLQPVVEQIQEDTEVVESIPIEVDDAPALWSIHAQPVDMQQLNDELESIVEYQHKEEDDVVVYDHAIEQEDNVEVEEQNQISSFTLYPTRAQPVILVDNSQAEILNSAFQSLGIGDWANAARYFQQIIAKQPNDPAVMNNYGLSLMERAFEMESSDDPTAADKAFAQYKSAILVLREAAKLDAENMDYLYNLSHALLLSGREEKTIELVKRIKSIEGDTPDTSVLMAACLFNQGLFDLAKKEILQFSNLEIVAQNLLAIPSI
jgi:tetratricopeptide (TPR) repeat protein